MSDVINDVVGMLIGLGPVGAALLWCDLQDRFRHRGRSPGVPAACISRPPAATNS